MAAASDKSLETASSGPYMPPPQPNDQPVPPLEREAGPDALLVYEGDLVRGLEAMIQRLTLMKGRNAKARKAKPGPRRAVCGVLETGGRSLTPAARPRVRRAAAQVRRRRRGLRVRA